MRPAVIGLFLSVVAVVPGAAAQPRDLTVWGRVGTGLASVGFAAGLEPDVRPGAVVGVALSDDANAIVALQGELLFIWKGATGVPLLIEVEPVPGLTVETSGDLRLGYLELPLLLKVGTPTRTGPRPALYAGPALALQVACETELVNRFFAEGTGDPRGESREELPCDAGGGAPRQRVDAGLIVGGGLEIPMGDRTVLAIEARYDHGLVTLDTGSGRAVRNRALMMLVGFGVRVR